MVVVKKFLQNKNALPLLIGVLLLAYLYLDTPVPVNLVLDNISLVIAVLITVIIFSCLCIKVNIFVAIIFALVVCEIIRKSLKPNLNKINKNIKYYEKTNSNSNVILSNKLKDSNTLEQEIVNRMVTVVRNDTPRQTPRYQPLLANSAGSSQVE